MAYESYNKRLTEVSRSYNLPSFGKKLSEATGRTVSVAILRSQDMLEDDLKTCFNIIKQTSAAEYAASSLGWRPREKMREMKDENMWYLMVLTEDTATGKSSIDGFLSFMFTHDDPPYEDRTVLYIYEIHMLPTVRGKGIGTKLIALAEEFARSVQVYKIMLTVFTSNAKGRQLYERLGFAKDECSPPDRQTRGRTIEADYKIMSKELPK